MTASELIALLRSRHAGEVFVPECKLGPAGSRAMDAFALLPTWSPMTAIGYETKVARSDWTRDQKLHEYLPCCHLFYVVAPKGVVASTELPAGVGLLEPVGQGPGTRLVTRVKAARREVDHVAFARVLSYVLMWRVDTLDGKHPVKASQVQARRGEFWRAFVEGRAEARTIGHFVGPKLRKEIAAALDRAAVAERKAERLQEAADILAALGIADPAAVWHMRREVERRMQALHEGDLLPRLRQMRGDIDAILAAEPEGSRAARG